MFQAWADITPKRVENMLNHAEALLNHDNSKLNHANTY